MAVLGGVLERIYLDRLSSRQAERVARNAVATYRTWANGG